MLRTIVVLLCVAVNTEVLAFLFSSATWGINPFSSFNRQPRTEPEALRKGFTKFADCNVTAPILGNRYVKDDDYSLILIYDVNGFIAGIQIGIPNGANTYPPNNQRSRPFVLENNRWYLTAYFVDPAIICSGGRDQTQYAEEGTGTGVYIQNGTNPISDTFQLPMEESAMMNTDWVLGKCFYTMGNHYWYNISTGMDCDKFFPVFAMYNKGKLNSFGWAMAVDMDSSNVEHPPPAVLGGFFKPEDQPTCLSLQPVLTTMHIYLTNSPRLNLC